MAVNPKSLKNLIPANERTAEELHNMGVRSGQTRRLRRTAAAIISAEDIEEWERLSNDPTTYEEVLKAWSKTLNKIKREKKQRYDWSKYADDLERFRWAGIGDYDE